MVRMIAWSAASPGKVGAAHRDALGGDRHADHHLRQVGTLVLGVLGEAADRHLGRPTGFGAGGRRGPALHCIEAARKLGLRIGEVALEVGRGGIDEDHVAAQVQQVGGARKDRLSDLGQRRQQEVHRPVGGVLIEGGAVGDGHPLGHPAGGGQLGGRL